MAIPTTLPTNIQSTNASGLVVGDHEHHHDVTHAHFNTGTLELDFVRDYGAVADDTTNNASVLATACADAASNGRTLYIPPGTYKFTMTSATQGATMITAASNLRIRGAGRALTKLHFVAGGGALQAAFTVPGGVSNVTFEDLQMYSDLTGSAITGTVTAMGYCIYLGSLAGSTSADITIRNCELHHVHQMAINATGNATSIMNRVRVLDNHIHDIGTSIYTSNTVVTAKCGLNLPTGSAHEVRGNNFHDIGLMTDATRSSQDHSIYISNSTSDVVCNDNIFGPNADGIQLAGSESTGTPTTASKNWTIAGNTFKDLAGNGVFIEGDTTVAFTNAIVSGNRFTFASSLARTDFAFVVVSAAVGVNIVGNTMDHNSQTCQAAMIKNSSSFATYASTDIQFSNNLIRNAGATANGLVVVGAAGTVNRVMVCNNHIYGVGTANGSLAIYVYGNGTSLTDVTVQGNRVHNVQYGIYYFGGTTSTIQDTFILNNVVDAATPITTGTYTNTTKPTGVNWNRTGTAI